MKIVFLLCLVACLAACKPYKGAAWNTQVPLERFSQIDKASNRLKSFNDLPRRIKNTMEFKDQAVTTDSVCFNSSPHTTSLFLYGAYDKKTKAGYVVQRFLTADNIRFNQCMLFFVRNDDLCLEFYKPSGNTFLWADIVSDVSRPHERLFGGGIAVFKPKKRRKK